MNTRQSTLLTTIVVLSLLPNAAGSQVAQPKKLAFLVGVDKYQKDGLADLNYADDDIEAYEQSLKSLGFECDVLLRDQAKLATIRERFAQFIHRAKRELGKDDIVFVALSGHGLQKDIPRDGKIVTEAYFCPYDAYKFDPDTLWSVNEVMAALENESASSQNLLVIDACRDDASKGAKGLDGSTVKELPAKLSVLFSCSTGQRSYESTQVKHGVFSFLLLEALRGQGANSRAR